MNPQNQPENTLNLKDSTIHTIKKFIEERQKKGLSTNKVVLFPLLKKRFKLTGQEAGRIILAWNTYKL